MHPTEFFLARASNISFKRKKLRRPPVAWLNPSASSILKVTARLSLNGHPCTQPRPHHDRQYYL